MRKQHQSKNATCMAVVTAAIDVQAFAPDIAL